eukprot:TRINITY_DN92938_c0_g1_i1.p1 TRINITY_DN92938_c0_g1~~TRINITY_DN92938_c0_g1_i1.p1  ORF type:complete len:353 (+),score=36.49 TRINITY_DN92938_c0_g1_i1:154-1059(+)
MALAAGQSQSVACGSLACKAPALGDVVIHASKVLYESPSGLSVAIQDLRPILPGHSLVFPIRRVTRLSELSRDEMQDLFSTVTTVQGMLRGTTGCSAFNLAVKDGPGAGPPVPHTHVHVVPRQAGDVEVNDAVYDWIDRWTPLEDTDGGQSPKAFEVPADEDRRPRTQEDMAREAAAYAALAVDSAELPKGPVQFGKFKLEPTQVFFASKAGHTLATVNLKPLVPGHVLVISRRVAPLLSELSEEELQDLWDTVRSVQTLIQDYYGAPAANLGVQDGREAGQSVPHVHVHVLPLGQPAAGQ